jgi:acetylornithine/succinyldiaminopimelate/putrescine aminotransferase
MPTIRQLFLEYVGQTSPTPPLFEPVKGDGVFLYDKNGKAYFDMISGIGPSGMGHNVPEVKEAIQKQTDLYLHSMVYGEYAVAPQALFAKELAEHLPRPLNNVFFTNTGSEAAEGALKLAKKYTGRYEVVALENAYHGSTHATMCLMSDPTFNRAYRPMVPGVRFMKVNEPASVEKININTAAVIMETLQGEAGCRELEKDFVQAVRKRCDETGALLILDEIQAGMGRTGKLWAFEHYDIVPDVLLLSKAFGGGMPLGAFISSKQHMEALSNNPILGHINTFGGHAVCCAAAHAHFRVMIKGGVIDTVEAKEKLLRSTLKHPRIEKIHGKGLMLAVELDSPERVFKTIELCMNNGFLSDWFLFNPKCVRIAPPLTITMKQIRDASHIFLECLNKAEL